MLFKIYLSIFLHLIPISDCSKIEITNIDRIFPQSSVLHILGNFNNSYHKFWNRNLFKFLLYNSKFPKLLHHLPNNDIRDNRYYQNCRRTCPKNLGHFATQISIIFLPKLQTREIFYRTQNGLHTCGENPTYMFLVVIIRYFQINLEGKLSSALFVIYHPLKSSTNSVNISVVCYTCRLKLIEVPHPNSGGIDSLYSFWKVQNSNLHGFMIESDGMSQFNPNKETCSAIKRGVRAFSRKFICAQLALGRKLNFTDVAIFGIKYPQYQKDSGHKIFYHVAATISSMTQENIILGCLIVHNTISLNWPLCPTKSRELMVSRVSLRPLMSPRGPRQVLVFFSYLLSWRVLNIASLGFGEILGQFFLKACIGSSPVCAGNTMRLPP